MHALNHAAAPVSRCTRRCLRNRAAASRHPRARPLEDEYDEDDVAAAEAAAFAEEAEEGEAAGGDAPPEEPPAGDDEELLDRFYSFRRVR